MQRLDKALCMSFLIKYKQSWKKMQKNWEKVSDVVKKGSDNNSVTMRDM